MKRGIEGHQWSKLRRLGSKKDDQGLKNNYKLQVIGGSAPRITTAATTSSSTALTMSEFISRFDEVARSRLNSMNEKLRGLEIQMESFEAEMHRANDPSICS